MQPLRHLSEHGQIRTVETTVGDLRRYAEIYQGQISLTLKRVRDF